MVLGLPRPCEAGLSTRLGGPKHLKEWQLKRQTTRMRMKELM